MRQVNARGPAPPTRSSAEAHCSWCINPHESRIQHTRAAGLVPAGLDKTVSAQSDCSLYNNLTLSTKLLRKRLTRGAWSNSQPSSPHRGLAPPGHIVISIVHWRYINCMSAVSSNETCTCSTHSAGCRLSDRHAPTWVHQQPTALHAHTSYPMPQHDRSRWG
jgi:hypothetical protein